MNKKDNGLPSNVVREKDIERIGKEVCDIRIALRMSQKELAEALSVSRATINRLENSKEVSLDIAFRLYYAMQKILENVYIDDGLKEQCRDLKNLVENTCILKSTEFSPIAYTLQ